MNEGDSAIETIRVTHRAHDRRSPEVRFRVSDMVEVVIFFAAVTAVGEVIAPVANRVIQSEPVYVRSHELWAPLLVDALILGSVGLLSLPAVMRLSRPMAIRITCAILGSAGCLSLLCLETPKVLSRIGFLPKIILAIGVGVALQEGLARRTRGLERLARYGAVALVALVAAAATGVERWHRFRESRTIVSLPDPPASAPNVLLIVLDTVRAESMSLYGYERPTTPLLNEFAREGVVFQRAIATAPWTLPSHASMFTGRFAYETKADWTRPLDDRYSTLAEVLGRHGYVTGGFVANTLYCRIESGLARGFAHYEDSVVSPGEIARNAAVTRSVLESAAIRQFLRYYEHLGRKPATQITNSFIEWLDRIPGKRKFFAFLNYFDAHQPYFSPSEYARQFGSRGRLDTFLSRYSRRVACSSRNTTPEETQAVRNAYDAAIAYLDNDLSRLFGELRRRQLLDNTLIVVTSDHGEECGEHDMFGHRDLYMKCIHVPLVLRLPAAIPAGTVVPTPVTLRDIPATVIDLLGLADKGSFPGRSLSRHWLTAGSPQPERTEPLLSELGRLALRPQWEPASKGDMSSIVNNDMHCIFNGDGTEEVYDIRLDPTEQNNVRQTAYGALAAEQTKQILGEIIH
jgi:arylsulfatase A-like enzyme